LDWQKNSKTKAEKSFFFNFISSYAEMSLLGPKKLKSHQKIFKTDFKMGQFTFVACSYQKLEPKTRFFKGFIIFSKDCFLALT
jgi:hypothetical protein